jgi:hypothetical protein
MTVTVTPAEYWRLRYLQEKRDHAKAKALLLELRETEAHAAAWAALTEAYPALATHDAWTWTDATTSFSAPDAPADQP